MENLEGSKRAGIGTVNTVKDGRARISKSLPIPNMAYSKSQVKTLQAEKRDGEGLGQEECCLGERRPKF